MGTVVRRIFRGGDELWRLSVVLLVGLCNVGIG
jgi:hypothetical protein